ncbi:uncharacterized protein LOC110375650 isoform X1 [Helicoverpa armigera]|uniref:uncharacterized protein LOC110375650 isoform X1 n=2 Tax=Helicoverpa armigera TaxID=29058 RepID=UPI0030834DB8
MYQYITRPVEEKTMFYENDFAPHLKTNKIFSNSKKDENNFNVIITKNKVTKKDMLFSIAFAAKPLIYFASLFGSKLVSYEKNDIRKIMWFSRLYSLLFTVHHILAGMVFARPLSWRYTKSDVPLNVLTKTFGILSILEGAYSVLCTSVWNPKFYLEIFNKLDAIDTHFRVSRTVFGRRRIISIFLVILPAGQLISCILLTRFRVQNIAAYLNFFVLMLQGAILYFFVINIYLKLLWLNNILENTTIKRISNQKKMVFKDTIWDSIVKGICKEPKMLKDHIIRYSWFELMQIYDKVADCIDLFNKIYCGQIFVMYNLWLLCTLLTICRSLSPSVKYSEVYASDLFMYFSLNSRPMFLAIMCEMFMSERKKTLSLLLHVLQLHEGDDQKYSQIKTMIMLAESRKLEITTNVFAINVPTVMNFAGRTISYTVLMIQYFYNHVF